MYEAEQLMQLADGGSDTETMYLRTPPLEDGAEVVWVWKDWERDQLTAALGEAGELTEAALAILDNGGHCEFLWGGASGLPSVVFPTGDPTLFVEAQPFQKWELVGRLHEFEGRHHVSREAPLAEFRLTTEPD